MTTTMPMKKTSVLLADSQAMFLELLTPFLEREFPNFTFIAVSTIKEARMLFDYHAFDLLITDLTGLESSGFPMILEARELSPLTRSIILAGEMSPFWVQKAIREGVLGIVSKVRPLKELVCAIHDVLDGRKHLSPEIAQQLMEYVNFSQKTDPLKLLSRRELEIFVQIGQGRPVKMIAEELGISARTISVHKHNIAKKTGITSSVKIARYCMKHGMLELKPEPIEFRSGVDKPNAAAA